MAGPVRQAPLLGHATGRDPRLPQLVRQGQGNETGRLAILRQHQQRITAQLAALTACLEVITFKVKIYEESLAEGTADPIWTPPSGVPAR